MKAKAKKKPAKKADAPPKGRPGRAPGPRDKDLETIHNEVTAQPKKEEEHLEQWVQVACPYCGEEWEVHATSQDDGQTMYEDCHVCCRPVSLHIQVEDGEIHVEAHRS